MNERALLAPERGAVSSRRAGADFLRAAGTFALLLALALAASSCRRATETEEKSGAEKSSAPGAAREASAGEKTAGREVVVYTALDQNFSEPLLRRFEEKTGIRARAVYDTEAVKTVGLVNRLIAEAPRPRCDVFWNNEIVRTLLLKRRGLTQTYFSPEAAAIPAAFRDPEAHWTGFAARARVIIYNKKLLEEGAVPDRFEAIADPAWRGRSVIGSPLFGTTSTHAAILWSHLGAQKTQEFFTAARRNGVIVAAGNAMSRDQVAQGEVPWGWTDSDDTNGALLDGKPVGFRIPEVELAPGGPSGILLIPNTVCLIRACPHPEEGKALIDFLLSAEVEEALARGRSAQMPLRPGLAPPPGWEEMASRAPLAVDWERALDALEPSARWLEENFVP